METAIVTVRQPDNNLERDLEIPVQIEASTAARMLAEALGLTGCTQTSGPQFRIHATVPGAQPRTLGDEERLSEAGIWDGAYLELQMISAQKHKSVRTEQPGGGDEWPVGEWIPLDIPSIPESEDEPPQQSDSGYVWRQLDE